MPLPSVSAPRSTSSHSVVAQPASTPTHTSLFSTTAIADQLFHVEEWLKRTLQSQYPAVERILQHVGQLCGKHLRPTLVILSAEAVGGATDETIRLAAVAELVHMATLVHDDVIDHADIRRHLPTVNVRWGTQQSILCGDWLFTKAYELASLGESTLPARWIAQAACQVCEGEIRQNASAGNMRLLEQEYIDIIAAKTGQLCAISSSIGAWSAQAEPCICRAMHAFGLHLGIAFQIYDDWLDIWGSEKRTGKTLGTDQSAHKPTLPWIYHWQNHPDESATFDSDIRADEAASDYTLQRANEYVERCLLELATLPATASRHCLEQLARSAIRHS